MDIATLKSKRSLVWGAILLIILILFAAAPSIAPGNYRILHLLPSIFMYIVLAVGWTIFSGPTGYMSLAPAAFFGVGIYAAAILGNKLPLLIVVGIGGLASSILGLLVGALTLRLRGIYFAVFTFGLVMLIAYFLLFYELHVTGTRGRFVVVVDYTTIYYILLGILVLLLLTAYIIRRSKYGLALITIGQEEEAAAHTGVNVVMVKVITFAISAFFMGAAGTIMATRWTYIDPFIAFNPFFSFMAVVMTYFGGIGHFCGPILGAAVLTYLEEFLITRFAELYMIIFGAILVGVLLYLPEGLAGLIQKIWKRFTERKHANT